MMKFIDDFKNIDVSVTKVMNNGVKFSFVLGLLATYILFFYIQNPVSHVIFEAGYAIIKCSIMFFVCFLVGAFATDKILKFKK